MSSQKERILRYIKETGSISSYECMLNLGICDLQHSIMELRREGYNITDRWESSKSVLNRKSKYKVYTLED